MAGANYSGNLIDPGKSIGTGTIAAIFFSVTIYALLAVAMGSAFAREDLQRNYFILQAHAVRGDEKVAPTIQVSKSII